MEYVEGVWCVKGSQAAISRIRESVNLVSTSDPLGLQKSEFWHIIQMAVTPPPIFCDPFLWGKWDAHELRKFSIISGVSSSMLFRFHILCSKVSEDDKKETLESSNEEKPWLLRSWYKSCTSSENELLFFPGQRLE